MDRLKPSVTPFSHACLKLLGCDLQLLASTAEGREELDSWLAFSLSGETIKCVQDMKQGEVFTSEKILKWCAVANPGAKIT